MEPVRKYFETSFIFFDLIQVIFIKVDENKPVLVAGDPEAIHMKKCDENKGISYHINQIKYAVIVFSFFKIDPNL